MSIRAVFCLSLTLAAGAAFAQQQDGFKKPAHKMVVALNDPVTVGEAAATFDRVRGLLKNVLNVKAPSVLHSGSAGKPVSRAQVIDAMLQLYESAKPVFTNTPKAVKVEYTRIKPDSASIKPKLIELIQRGCIAGYGPLAMGSKKTLTVQEFGDAVGFFLARIAEMTNRSDPKWTPAIKDYTKPG